MSRGLTGEWCYSGRSARRARLTVAVIATGCSTRGRARRGDEEGRGWLGREVQCTGQRQTVGQAESSERDGQRLADKNHLSSLDLVLVVVLTPSRRTVITPTLLSSLSCSFSLLSFFLSLVAPALCPCCASRPSLFPPLRPPSLPFPICRYTRNNRRRLSSVITRHRGACTPKPRRNEARRPDCGREEEPVEEQREKREKRRAIATRGLQKEPSRSMVVEERY